MNVEYDITCTRSKTIILQQLWSINLSNYLFGQRVENESLNAAPKIMMIFT